MSGSTGGILSPDIQVKVSIDRGQHGATGMIARGEMTWRVAGRGRDRHKRKVSVGKLQMQGCISLLWPLIGSYEQSPPTASPPRATRNHP